MTCGLESNGNSSSSSLSRTSLGTEEETVTDLESDGGVRECVELGTPGGGTTTVTSTTAEEEVNGDGAAVFEIRGGRFETNGSIPTTTGTIYCKPVPFHLSRHAV